MSPVLTKLERDLCDVEIVPGVVIHMALTEYAEPGVWSVEIDGHEYREPRDLTDEPLRDGPFRTWLVTEIDRRNPTNDR